MPGFLQQGEMNKLNIFCIIMNLKAVFNKFIWRSLRAGSFKIIPISKNHKYLKWILLKFLYCFATKKLEQLKIEYWCHSRAQIMRGQKMSKK